MASYVQESQRSVAQPNEVILPQAFTDLAPDDLEGVLGFLNHAHNLYKQLQDHGMRREDARYILPQAFTTLLRMTANFRTWMHFLRLRLHPAAQGEIKSIAQTIQILLEEACPAVFSMRSLVLYTEVPEWSE